MAETFVSERIFPETAVMEPESPGSPALPRVFRWREETVTIADVKERWKESGPCRMGANERYIRKHWYVIETTDHRHMRLYFERQPRTRTQAAKKARWWLYSVG